MPEPTGRHKGRGRLQHWFILLVSPFIVSLFASFVISISTEASSPQWLRNIMVIAGVAWFFLYAIFYTNLLQKPRLMIIKALRTRRFGKPYVIILNGNIDDASPGKMSSTYTNRRPDDWRYELKKQNPAWKIELASTNRTFEECPDILVNPFGEVYPEEDISSHSTFRRIRDYVYNGGVYVNVAGYPFWYKANPFTGMKTPAGNIVASSPGSSIFIIQSLLPDYLGITPVMPGSPILSVTKQGTADKEQFGELAGAGGQSDAKMFRQYDISTQPMIPMLRTDNGQYIIIGAVPFGDGYFVFAGVEIDQNSTAFEKVLAAIQGWAKYEHEKRVKK
jgi:hypothetical protein